MWTPPAPWNHLERAIDRSLSRLAIANRIGTEEFEIGVEEGVDLLGFMIKGFLFFRCDVKGRGTLLSIHVV